MRINHAVIATCVLAFASASADVTYLSRAGHISVFAPGHNPVGTALDSGPGLGDLNMYLDDWWGYVWSDYYQDYLFSDARSELRTGYATTSAHLFGLGNGSGWGTGAASASLTFVLETDTPFYALVGAGASAGSSARIAGSGRDILLSGNEGYSGWLAPGQYTVDCAASGGGTLFSMNQTGWFRFELGIPAPGAAVVLALAPLAFRRRRP